MKFLVRKTGKKVKAHVWTGTDTVCRMWSTDGLKHSRYVICDTDCGLEICHMCGHLASAQISVPSVSTQRGVVR